MLNLRAIIVEEADCRTTTPETCDSWERNHRLIGTVLHDLYEKPFRVR